MSGMKIVVAAMLMAAFAGCATAAEPQQPVSSGTTALPPLPNLMDIVGDADTVIFGEDSHGLAVIHQVVPAIFRQLVEQGGFRVFVFESKWGLSEGLADFMNSDRTELNAVDSYWLNGAFASQPIADMLVWIRNWNRAHPDDPIIIAGNISEQPVRDFRALFAYLQTTAPGEVGRLRVAAAPCRAADAATYPTDLDFMMANGRLARERRPSYTDAERAACLSGLDEIEAVLNRSDRNRATEPERGRARLHVASLRTYISLLLRSVDTAITHPDMPLEAQVRLQSEMYTGGDETRFRNYQALRRLDFPGRKVFLWMHNWHAFRHASETGEDIGTFVAGLDGLDGPVSLGTFNNPRGTISVGERLARSEGRRAVTIGNIVPCGTTCQEPADSIEPAFARRFGNRIELVDLRSGRNADLPVDRPVTLSANPHGRLTNVVLRRQTNVVLRRQLDAILYVPPSTVDRH